MNGHAAKATQTPDGWVASEYGIPIPGVYATEAAALAATSTPLPELEQVVEANTHVDGAIQLDDLDEQYRARGTRDLTGGQ